MKLRVLFALLALLAAPAAPAAEEAYGVGDITLGASYARLERDLDFRDIATALAQMSGTKPDFGRRGYGCMRRDDPMADVGCVSHNEKFGDVETREIRLHFLSGRLYQFSLSAEVQHYDAVAARLRERYGAPQSAAGAEPARWQNESAHIALHRGKDLVFVNFELAAYTDAVKRKREGVSLECY